MTDERILEAASKSGVPVEILTRTEQLREKSPDLWAAVQHGLVSLDATEKTILLMPDRNAMPDLLAALSAAKARERQHRAALEEVRKALLLYKPRTAMDLLDAALSDSPTRKDGE